MSDSCPAAALVGTANAKAVTAKKLQTLYMAYTLGTYQCVGFLDMLQPDQRPSCGNSGTAGRSSREPARPFSRLPPLSYTVAIGSLDRGFAQACDSAGSRLA
jgi:hypothetical protein